MSTHPPGYLRWPGLRCILDTEGRFTWVSTEWGERLGYSAGSLVGRTLLDYVHPDDHAATHDVCFTTRFRDAEGGYRLLAWETAPVERTGRTCVVHDVSDHEALERRLALAEARFDHVIAHAPVIVFAFDDTGRITLHDGRGLAAGRHERGELVGQSVFELYPSDHPLHRNARRVLAGEAFSDLVLLGDPRLVYDSRYTPQFDEAGRVVGAIGVAIDVTERERAEHALRQTEVRLLEADRMANFGLLAAGIAHEINNPLTYVRLNLGRLTSLELSRQPLTPVRLHRLELLRESREGIERVEQIVRDLRRLARTSEGCLTPAPVDVASVLESTLHVVAHEIRYRARLACDFAAVPPVLADEGRLSQVFMNLLVNAAQSIPEGEAHLNEIRVSTRLDQVAGGRVIVEISDTGTGISPDNLTRVFEPFFTTKPAGAGTGLGLSICQDLVTALGGEITVESTVGRGTTFRVALPAAREAVAQEVAATPAPVTTMPPRRGRVLVIDDERAVAVAVADVLGEHHEVRVAGSGREALALLQADRDFDVILSDLMMPEVTGIDLYEALELVDPGLAERVVFMTAGAFTPRAHALLAAVPNARLEKPFTPSALLDLVNARMAALPAPHSAAATAATEHAKPRLVKQP